MIPDTFAVERCDWAAKRIRMFFQEHAEVLKTIDYGHLVCALSYLDEVKYRPIEPSVSTTEKL